MVLEILSIYGKNGQAINPKIISHFADEAMQFSSAKYNKSEYILSSDKSRFFIYASDNPESAVALTSVGGLLRSHFFMAI
ncbi:MAG: hypothetical protein LBB44_06050 [Endomicrobium sp.]|jgi:hypothetical protein|nr:hypothetical protein [Endomicrobium sp.]